MNKTVGSTLLVAGTMIGAGMLAMPLTSAGIGFSVHLAFIIRLVGIINIYRITFC